MSDIEGKQRARIQPPLLKKELVSLFFNNFKKPFHEYYLGNESTSFVEITRDWAGRVGHQSR